MSERGQQQGGGQQRQGGSQQQQQQLSPAQGLARALTGIRQVQSWVELNHPQQRNVIVALRESGDLVWGVIQGMQQQQQQRQQGS
jgi:predicted RNA binding protein YcfA (HicA-like mRNA interferase family)